jgi:hypothetical protein
MSKLIYRDELVNLIFPLGVPAHDWDYCISASAIYKAIMNCKVVEHDDPLANLRKIKETGFAPKKDTPHGRGK